MYSVDLSKIKIKDFAKLLKSIDLLPGRRILLNGLDEIILLFEKNNCVNLADIQKLLKNKNNYEELSKNFKTSEDYLVVLNREVNSYINKPIKLEEIAVISKKIVNQLNQSGIKTTKDIYEICIIQKNRKSIIEETGITSVELNEIISLSDLLRINGVGPAYAMILFNIGIKSVKDYFKTESIEILEKFQNENKGNKYTKANLGIKDVEYCKRFCMYLDQEI